MLLYSRSPDLTVVRMEGGDYLVYDRRRSIAHVLNETAAFIINQLATPKTEEQIVEGCRLEYDGPASEIQSEVRDFLRKLCSLELLCTQETDE
ncbi:MAG: PqqD family protein [Firmicutes bacterium]|nr:PqqD family protein [Candidatus Fermentithermobacillaceae bacterium]